MRQFYSSLVINTKKYPDVHQVLRPRYNKEFFKRITANIDNLEEHIKRRSRINSDVFDRQRLQSVKDNCKQLVRLREHLERLNLPKDEAKYQDVLQKIEAVEDLVMPTVIALPNRTSNLVPESDTILEEVESDFQKKQKLTKILSHRKLAYINNCYTKSVVGPNSHYYVGIGAKLNHSLSDYFSSQLHNNKFIALSGLCLVKSALVEAANALEDKSYLNDPARIVTDQDKMTTLHISEASTESLLGFLATLGHVQSDDALRLYSSGSCYHKGSYWFDGEDRHISQSEAVHAMVLNSSIESYSMKEYLLVKDLIWNMYKELKLPLRLVHCSTDSMLSNEFDSHRIDVWLPSLQDWQQVSRIAHYRDYLTVRVGMRRGHVIDSQVYDGQTLIAAIIENQQTADGRFIIPEVITNNMQSLSNEELDKYTAMSKKSARTNLPLNRTNGTLNNYEQRRFFRPRNWKYSHSESDFASKNWFMRSRWGILWLILISTLIDWTSLWVNWIPDALRRRLYENVYRPIRRKWWNMLYYGMEEQMPEDLSWDEIKKSRLFTKSKAQNNFLAMLDARYGDDPVKDLVRVRIETLKKETKELEQSAQSDAHAEVAEEAE